MERSAIIQLKSSAVLSVNRREYRADVHFRWSSIMNYLYLANTFAGSCLNFDVTSGDKIYSFVILEVTVGMSYMCMDMFIRQYTRKVDSLKSLNPLLRGTVYGIFLQTTLWALLHVNNLADSLRYFVISLKSAPAWSKCPKNSPNCVPSKNLNMQCKRGVKKLINVNVTSTHINYNIIGGKIDRASITSKTFISAVIWIVVFIMATISDTAPMKVFKLTFIWVVISTLITTIAIFIYAQEYGSQSMRQILNIRDSNSSINIHSSESEEPIDHVTYAFGIGLISIYDFEVISPYTMVDNAVVIFTLYYTAVSFMRSLIVRILLLYMSPCINVEADIDYHYVLFTLIPLSTELLSSQKFYLLYLYVNLIVTLMSLLVLLVISMAKLLNSEFRSIKNIYLIGAISALGFGLTLCVTMMQIMMVRRRIILGLILGLNVTTLYLGAMKVAIVMWVYGVTKFSTDIHFFLGFKPKKFWIVLWLIIPLIFWGYTAKKIHFIATYKDTAVVWISSSWFLFSAIFVLFIQIKTITKYLMDNNIAGIFSSSRDYGPENVIDRKKRRNYDEMTPDKKCKHHCFPLDEFSECNHLPVTLSWRDDQES